MRLDYLPNHRELKIKQDERFILINTDTQVLGEFLNIYRYDTVLDLGCNTGGLMLYASTFNPRKITGLDINEEALKLCDENMKMNHISNYELICDNLLTYTSKTPYDVIICNPPYFKTDDIGLSSNPYLNLAKHETNGLTLEGLMACIYRNLKDGGTLYFLYLTSRMQEVFHYCDQFNLKIKELKMVYDENKPNANIFMIKACRNGKIGLKVGPNVVISRKQKEQG